MCHSTNCPHGNAIRNKRPFRRTRESTKKLLQSELEKNCDAKEAVKKVFDKRGGVLSAQSIGELPRNRSQAYNIKRTLEQRKMVASVGGKVVHDTPDMLYVVMEQCKQAEKTDVFVQDVTCAPEPMAVLCSEQQLVDVSRFCCDQFNFSILGIDPTLVSSVLLQLFISTFFFKTSEMAIHHYYWDQSLSTTESNFAIIIISFQHLLASNRKWEK